MVRQKSAFTIIFTGKLKGIFLSYKQFFIQKAVNPDRFFIYLTKFYD